MIYVITATSSNFGCLLAITKHHILEVDRACPVICHNRIPLAECLSDGGTLKWLLLPQKAGY